MSHFADITYYLLNNYPHKKEMSKARFVKTIYLIDWKAAYDLGRQLTEVNWYFNHYGPYVIDIIEQVKGIEGIIVKSAYTSFGEEKELILLNGDISIELPEDEKKIVDSVINYTKKMYWQDFIDAVYRTYPIRISTRYSELNLIQIAEQLKAISPKA